jgi:hypothetical protein
MFFLQQNQRRRGGRVLPGSRGMAETMYTHVNKCKNDKIKRKKQKRHLVKHTSVCVGRGISRD